MSACVAPVGVTLHPSTLTDSPRKATVDFVPLSTERVIPSDEPTTGTTSDVQFIEGVVIHETTITLPTYPYQQYQSKSFDGATKWPYFTFDRDRYEAANPSPENKSYRLIVLENRYLRLSILPELGGRLWQVLHKSSGNLMFYQNSVVKPSPWGPANQLGWLALGGLEWNLPVIEHGYEWGTPWLATVTQHSPEAASVTVETVQDERLLHASITITLHAGSASFEIEPQISNRAKRRLQFDYWQSAMLAPGPDNRPSADLHFVLPTTEMTVHSTGDETLPLAGQTMRWPLYRGRDLSRLGNWKQYIGLFESPVARGPFVGVYDRTYNAGGVRVFPALTVPGSKLFGLGWQNALRSDYFTDDGSGYVELHAGLSPTFSEPASLDAGESITWKETWYPVHGIGDLTFANAIAAIDVEYSNSLLNVGLYPVYPVTGTLTIEQEDEVVASQDIFASPEKPLSTVVTAIGRFGTNGLTIRLEDTLGRILLETKYP